MLRFEIKYLYAVQGLPYLLKETASSFQTGHLLGFTEAVSNDSAPGEAQCRSLDWRMNQQRYPPFHMQKPPLHAHWDGTVCHWCATSRSSQPPALSTL